MKPDDANGALPTAERPFRVLLIAASQRRQYNCPGVDSKARTLMLRMADQLPQQWEIDLEDLGNVYGRARIQSCNACVSTAMALCVWPCNCYEKKHRSEPDLLWDLDLYARLDLADAWAFIAPVNWYGPTSNLKALFDRLVCANGGNPDESSIAHKDPELAVALEQTARWQEMSQNHLEGRTAAFFCYEDDGADEIAADGRPESLRHPEWFTPADEPFENARDAYRPLVWQCRYSGIEVPDDLWSASQTGAGIPYRDNQAEHAVHESLLMGDFDAWVQRFARHVADKGKVPAGRWRAYGYRAPGHFLADVRLAWRDVRMRIGRPRMGSSPQVQQREGLNRDVTLSPKSSIMK